MLGHFIHFKGKGGWVFGVPIICGVLLFTFCDVTGISNRYFRPICFIISAVILWYVDKGDNLIRYGQNITKRKNTVIFIEMKYWAILLALAGFFSLKYT
jgi:hypothetical protein